MARTARSLLAIVSFLGCFGWFFVRNARPQPAAGGGAVEYFDHRRAEATAGQRAALFKAGNFSVVTARRNQPGEVEIHAADTDIVYVVDGSAVFATGGRIVNARSRAPDEIRGTEMTGGALYHLSRGDVIVVPPGVTHWFKEVPDHVFYFVVKVRARQPS